jgi:CheY-like chemotaxis protein
MATVLIVDDGFGVVDVLTLAFEDEGHHVLAAVNGRQGLERLAREKVDLVLLDFMMPTLDGPGMFRAMRANPALHGIPVVVMTSLEEAKVRQECHGYTAYLRKPFSITRLPQLVVRVLGGDSAAGGKTP